MTVRLPTHLAVGALIRRANDGGGFAALRASGDPQTGAILILLDERDGFGPGRMRAIERVRDLDDRDEWIAAGPADATDSAMEDYWRARRARDPDLWVIELCVAGGERFVAETIGGD